MSDWSDKWILSVHPDKSKFMTSGNNATSERKYKLKKIQKKRKEADQKKR